MPLITRTVSPIHVFAGRLPPDVTEDEIQCVNNGALANLIRQMGSLSRHAHSVFDNVRTELNEQDKRVEKIHDRLQALLENLSQPELPKKPVTHEEDQKQFKSINRIDRHPLDRSTMPAALKELYDKCDDPPKLHLWDQFRDDPKPAIKFYTDPQYFIDLWVSEMNELPPERAVSPNRRNRRPRTSSATRQASAPINAGGNVIRSHFHAQSNRNQDFVHFPSEYQAPQLLRHQVVDDSLPPPPGMSLHQQPSNYHDNNAFPDPPKDLQSNFQGLQLTSNLEFLDDDDDELPPPPPPLSDHSHLMPGLASPSTSSTNQFQHGSTPTPPPVNHINFVAASADLDLMNLEPQSLPPPPTMNSGAPPPPPPPPPPPLALMTASTIQPNPSGTFASGDASEKSKETKEIPTQRGNLLEEIRAGMKLKRVQQQAEREAHKAALAGNDIAAVLRHRMKRIRGESSDEDDQQDDDDDEWD